MAIDKLYLDPSQEALIPSKTEFLLLGTPQQLTHFDQIKPLKLGNSIVKMANTYRNLGNVFKPTIKSA